jgi:hypothetical protein
MTGSGSFLSYPRAENDRLKPLLLAQSARPRRSAMPRRTLMATLQEPSVTPATKLESEGLMTHSMDRSIDNFVTKETRTNNCFDFLPGNREQSRGERQQAIQLFLRVS